MAKFKKTKCDTCNSIIKVIRKTRKEIKEMMDGRDFKNPVDIDMLKTKKAMAYEKIIELIPREEEEDE